MARSRLCPTLPDPPCHQRRRQAGWRVPTSRVRLGSSGLIPMRHPVEREHTFQFACVEGTCFGGPGIAGKDPESVRSEEKPGLRDAGARFFKHSADSRGPTGGDIVLHKVLERLSDATDGIRRLKTKARGEFGIRRRAPGSGLI
jgi:hypothetical protein